MATPFKDMIWNRSSAAALGVRCKCAFLTKKPHLHRTCTALAPHLVRSNVKDCSSKIACMLYLKVDRSGNKRLTDRVVAVIPELATASL